MKKIAKKNISKDIILEDIISFVREVVPSCYGVVGIANISKRKGKVEEGLKVSMKPNKMISVVVYLVVDSEVKITETIRSTQENIIYRLNRVCPKRVESVSVYVEEIASKK